MTALAGGAVHSDQTRRWMARGAVAAMGSSVALMVAVGIQGPSAAVATFPAAAPWPPWFLQTHLSPMLAGPAVWLAVLLGSTGLIAGLLATRYGWRPRPGHLIAGSVLAVLSLAVIPPVGSADMLDYAVSGRIAVLGHSPYVMMPQQLKASGDPVGAVSVPGYRTQPSRYGPIETAVEAAASKLGGDSAARTIIWLKLWNGLAYLGLVIGLDRLFRADAAQRARAHLLWSVNPLMLWAVMAGGHNDGLAAAAGAAALFTLRSVTSRRALLAGILFGLAAAIKAPFALFGAGLAWATWRSPRALIALGVGATAVLVPGYAIAGRVAISASINVARIAPVDYTPWFALARVLNWQHEATRIDSLGVLGFAVLAAMLLWRMPPAPPDFPAASVALALSLAWLITTPQQHPWYFAIVFPLIAVIPASRLDWIVLLDASAAALGELPRLFNAADLHPAWLSSVARISYAGYVPLTLAAVGCALLWLCLTNDWRSAAGSGGPSWRPIFGDSGQARPHGHERRGLASDRVEAAGSERPS
jgi:hypothetical protein